MLSFLNFTLIHICFLATAMADMIVEGQPAEPLSQPNSDTGRKMGRLSRSTFAVPRYTLIASFLYTSLPFARIS